MPFLFINGINLHYDVTGHGAPLVFIHGLGSSGRDWQPQIEFSSCCYQVVTFDIRGHGQSDRPPGPYSIRLFADDAAKLIEALHIEPVHIVGLSLGGMIAFQLAVDHPALLRSMVIVNASPEMRLKSPIAVADSSSPVLDCPFSGDEQNGQISVMETIPRRRFCLAPTDIY